MPLCTVPRTARSSWRALRVADRDEVQVLREQGVQQPVLIVQGPCSVCTTGGLPCSKAPQRPRCRVIVDDVEVFHLQYEASAWYASNQGFPRCADRWR